MSNATQNLRPYPDGVEGYTGTLPVAASTHIYDGTLISQLTSGSTGRAVPYSTSNSGMCVGVAQHEQDNSSGADDAKRIKIEWDRVYLFPNGTSGDAFADTDLLNSLVFATDDHTAAKTSGSQARQVVGFFQGLDPDTGKVKVLVAPAAARLAVALVASLTDSTGGVVSNTLHDVTGTPTQTLINNNIASLGAKINAILAILAP